MQQSFIFGGNTGLSYDQIQKQRDIANELLRANMSTPQNVGEGLSAIGRALAAKAIDKRTSRADEANRQASEARRADAFGAIFGGGVGGGGAPAPFSPAPAAGPGAAVADDTMAALGKIPMRPFRDAIASIESAGSGDYGAVGPTHPKLGRALGRYQVMEANIGPWSREVLGREVTPDEFLANPALQDAIFDGKFGGYVQQFGPEGAAQAWFAGPGGVGKMGRQDSLGTSVADYTQKFTAALGGSSPAAPMQPAPAGNMSMGNPGNIQLIAELLADPYTPPGEKAMLEQAMAMQLQGMDPLRQLEMQKAQLELQQMQNPQAQPGFTMLTDEQEVQMGLNPAGVYQQGPDGSLKVVQDAPKDAARPMTAQERAAWGIPETDTTPYALVDGMPKAIGGGGVTVNNNMPASPEALGTEGQILVPDASEPSGFRVEVAAGSKLDTEQQAAERKSERASDVAITASQTVTDAANRALEAARGRDFGSGGTSFVGNLPIVGAMTDSGEVLRQNGVLAAQAITGNLQAMRDASPTGGALGAVTAPELKLLADKSGALDPDSPNYERDLADYTLTLLETIHGVEAGREVFRQTWKGNMPERLARQKSEPKEDAADVPSGIDPDDWKYMTPEERALFK